MPEAGSVYVSAIAPSDRPTPFGPTTHRSPATLLKLSPEDDLAVLDAEKVDFAIARKEPFDMKKIDRLTSIDLRDGDACFISGAWGSEMSVTPVGENRHFDVPLYAGQGWIKTVTSREIISRHEEEEVRKCNVEDFPNLKGIKVTGGSRDLSGMSGSGLWILGEDGTLLAGILTGPASGEIADPDIHHTPVWVLRELLQKLIDSSAAPTGR
jgi:hypothetical protein